MPAHAGTGPERLGDPRHGLQRAQGQHERAGRVDAAVRVGQGEGLLLGHRVGVVGRVVLDVAARGLAAQPLGDVARAGLGRRGQFLSAGRRGRQRLVQAEVVANDHVARRRRRAEVRDELAQELVQLVGVDSHDETPLDVRYAIPASLREGVATALQPGCNAAI